MILHIGDNIYVYKDNIMSILDRDTFHKNKKKNSLNEAGKNIIYGNFNEDEIKSYIILNINNEIFYYASRISSKTLKSRCDRKENLEWR